MNHLFTVGDPSLLVGYVPSAPFRLYYEPKAFFGKATISMDGVGCAVQGVSDTPGSWDLAEAVRQNLEADVHLDCPLHFYENAHGGLEWTPDLLPPNEPAPIPVPVKKETRVAEPVRVRRVDIPAPLQDLINRAESIVSTSPRTFEVAHYRNLHVAQTLVYLGDDYTLFVEFNATVWGAKRREVRVFQAVSKETREAIRDLVGR